MAETEKSNPIVIVAALLILMGSAGAVLFFRPKGQTYPPPPEMLGIWTKSASTCPQPSPERALVFAQEREQIAAAKRERRPFSVKDGIAAVGLYDLVAACYRLGGDAMSANEASAIAKKLRDELELDYRTHHAMMDHARIIGDLRTEYREVASLLEFTEGKTGDYVQWLSNEHRRLKLKFEEGPK